MLSRTHCQRILALSALLLAASSANAVNWPAFRGANAAGTADGAGPPLEWNSEDGTHVRWKTPIPGRAHSSPVIWGQRIYLTTAVRSQPEKEFRHGLYGDVDSEADLPAYTWRLLAIDKNSGKVLFDHPVHSGKPSASHHIKATQANASPVTDGQTIIASLGSEGLYAFAMDGKQLWRQDLGLLDTGWFFDPSYQWGHASSPVIHDGKVILQVDRSSDSFIAAFSLADGKQLWKTQRDNLPSWGTPTLLPAGDGFELVANGSKQIRGYDPESGKELWRLGPNSEVTVGTPVVGHGMVFVTGGYPPVRPIYALKPGGRGDLTLAEGETSSAHVAWSTTRGGTYMPTPLIYGDHLYMTANNGVLTCYDAKTGEQIYRQRLSKGSAAFSGSPVAADGRIYFASEDGDIYVVKAGAEYELLASNSLPEVIMTTPAITDGMLVVRGISNLYGLGEPPQEAPAEEAATAGE